MVGVQLSATFCQTRQVNGEKVQERVKNVGTAEQNDNDKDEQVFQKVSENLEPPINTQNVEQEMRKMC